VLGLRRRREARRRRQLSEVEEFLEELRATVGARVAARVSLALPVT